MAAAYSMDLRERVIQDADAGIPRRWWRSAITAAWRGSTRSSCAGAHRLRQVPRPAPSERRPRRGAAQRVPTPRRPGPHVHQGPAVHRWENLSRDGRHSLKKLLAANRRLNTAYVLKEQFGQLWEYQREGWARAFFERWRESLKWQRLKPYEKFAAMIEHHWYGIAAYCRPENKVSLGVVEGLNNKIRVLQRRAYGYRDEEYLKLKIIAAFLPPLPRHADQGKHNAPRRICTHAQSTSPSTCRHSRPRPLGLEHEEPEARWRRGRTRRTCKCVREARRATPRN